MLMTSGRIAVDDLGNSVPGLSSPPERISARVVSVPLEPRIITRHYRIETIEFVVLRVSDEAGLEGHSTLWCFGLPQTQVLMKMLAYLAPFALRPRSIDPMVVADELRREINFFGFKGVSVFALSAFDIALTDLSCRAAGCSLGKVLGQRRDTVPAYWSGLFGNQSLDEILDEVDQKLDEGFRAMKLRVGRPTLDEDVVRIEAVLARLPNNAVLMLDAVQSWSVNQALDAIDRLADLPIHWLEDPLVHNDYAGLRRLVEHARVPIATGENEYLREGFDQLFAARPPYLLADLERVGGIGEWCAIAARAADEGVTLTPHVFPHIALQLCSALDQTENWIEYIPWWDSLTAGSLPLKNGSLVVPDTPGAGLDLDQERVDAHAMSEWIELAARSGRAS
jgi:L-alanine-DL-glutamate epimerase-like enolase superfamily enzyme